MSTYEVETVFYNNYGGVQTKSCDSKDKHRDHDRTHSKFE